jgi:hypothetical protein
MLIGDAQSIDDLAECFRYDDTTVTPASRQSYHSLSSR